MTKKIPKRKGEIKNSIVLILPICAVISIVALSLFNFVFYSTSQSKNVLGVKIETNTKTALSDERFFWQNFLEENPTYLPGWLELAKIEVQLENVESARYALEMAKSIDPNSNVVNEVEKELSLF